MLKLLRRQLYQRGWEKVTYGDLLRYYPLHQLISTQIAVAVAEGATRITHGLPPGVELDKEGKAWILLRHENDKRNANLEQEDQSSHGPVQFHRRDGLPEIPCWHQIDGQWHQTLGALPCFYAYLPQYLCDRLVSLDGKPLDGGKPEWIEYTSVVGEKDRKFVRVDLIIEANNSVTIDLLETRVLHKATTVWWRHWRV